MRYSLLNEYIKRKVDVRVYSTTIEIDYTNNRILINTISMDVCGIQHAYRVDASFPPAVSGVMKKSWKMIVNLKIEDKNIFMEVFMKTIYNIGPNDCCWCGSGIKYKRCHKSIYEQMKKYSNQGILTPSIHLIKNTKQIDAIRKSAKINIAILDYITPYIIEGIDTETIDKLIYDETKRLGGIPATLNYMGYPKSVCTSINNQVCHGIPSPNIKLENGDIINIDCSTSYNGYFSDSSRMFCVGEVSAEKKRLVDVAKQCIQVGLNQVKPWGFLGDIGDAINTLARNNGYSVVQEIGGHGIGLEFHEDPWVGYTTKKGTGELLVPGMIFTIEPMINMGSPLVYTDEQDEWTVYTEDGLPSAQWEVMVLVTEQGYEVLAY